MPQWRKLHTRIRQSLDVNDMPDDFHRLLWSWLPLGLDREGRILDNPALVKAMVMPLREDVSLEQVQKALDWYTEHGMIMRYSVNGRSYLHVPTFDKYQGRRGREAVSIYPPPLVQEQVTELVHDQVTERVIPQNRIEVEEKRTDVEEIAAATPPPKPPKRRRKRKTDPRTQHPAIQAVREVTNRYPPKPLWDEIIKLLGKQPPVEELRFCFKEWVKPGFKPTNFAWLFDWYVSGIPPGRVHGSVQEETAGVIKRYRERHSGDT